MSNDKPTRKRKYPEIQSIVATPQETAATQMTMRRMLGRAPIERDETPPGDAPPEVPLPSPTSEPSLDKIRLVSPDNSPNLLDAQENNFADAQADLSDAQTPTKMIYSDAQTPAKHLRGRPRKYEAGVPENERRSKLRARISLRPRADILKRFKEFCLANEIDLQDFFELSGVHYIEQSDAHKNNKLDAKTPTDDLMILFKTDEDIISLYRKYLPLNKWKPRDDEAAQRFNNSDRRIIEYGILQCLLRAGKQRIHSFKYFVEEIHIIMDLHPGDEHVEAALSSLRRYWKRLHEKGNQ